MKGLSMSIRMVILLILAVVVLVAVIVFFTQTSDPTTKQISDMSAWQRGCNQLKLQGCDASVSEIEIDKYDGNLEDACEEVFGSNVDCKEQCCGE